jgi:hypothetical protein
LFNKAPGKALEWCKEKVEFTDGEDEDDEEEEEESE